MNTKTGKNIINKKINIVLILTVLLLFVTIAIFSLSLRAAPPARLTLER